MQRREFLKGAAAVAGAATVAKPAIAQGTTEISFYYPVAVGGPITKLIDTMAADFEKENPSIKLKPDLCGHLSGNAGQADHRAQERQCARAVRRPLHRHVYADRRRRIVPFDDFVKSDDDKKWLQSFFPAFMENSQTGGKTWGAPFQRSTVVLYWNKELFKEAGLDPEKAPANWAEQLAFAQEADQDRCFGRDHAMGHPGALDGFPLLAVPGFLHAGRCHPHEPGRQPHGF